MLQVSAYFLWVCSPAAVMCKSLLCFSTAHTLIYLLLSSSIFLWFFFLLPLFLPSCRLSFVSGHVYRSLWKVKSMGFVSDVYGYSDGGGGDTFFYAVPLYSNRFTGGIYTTVCVCYNGRSLLFIIIGLFSVAHSVISEMDGASRCCGDSPSMTLRRVSQRQCCQPEPQCCDSLAQRSPRGAVHLQQKRIAGSYYC